MGFLTMECFRVLQCTLRPRIYLIVLSKYFTMETSKIVEFFANQTIFITGGTGFIGKVIIEKLLRECSDLKKIHILLRPKKEKTPEERFAEFFSYKCFDGLKATNPEAIQKVAFISGDCQKPLFGLDHQDVDILRSETTCIIHAAASVKFDQNLKEAVYNVRATRDLLEFAKEMPNLKAFVYISTAFSNCIHSHMKEEFYEPPMKFDSLLSIVDAFDSDVLEAIKPQILGEWPNSYIFSKSVAEDLVSTVGKGLPLTIVRPAIICSSMLEPVPGWIDNLYGFIGLAVAVGLGVIRTLNLKPDAIVPLIPVDYVSNCILAAAWKAETSVTTKIYNFVGHKKNQRTYRQTIDILDSNYWQTISEKAVWYRSLVLIENPTLHKIYSFFVHTLLAYLADFALFCLRRPTLAVKNYRRLNKLLESLVYFQRRDWVFDDDNVVELWNEMGEEDKKKFVFSMEKLDWKDWSSRSSIGARHFLFKETDDTIPKMQRKLCFMMVANYTCLAIFWYLVYKFFCLIVNLVF